VRRPVRIAALALALAVAGCGYSLRGTLPPDIRTVAVPVFTNRTLQPAIETLVTRAILDAFATQGRLAVTHPEAADAILEGEIITYDVVSIAFDRRANVQQYRLVLTLNLRMRDRRRDTVLFQRTGLREQADFRVFGTVAETIAREESAVREAAREIGRSVVSLAVNRF
jgi:outer membrane lipopolysaccharide assembly protein LptE/RlpB